VNILVTSATAVDKRAESEPALLAYSTTRFFALSTVMILPAYPNPYHPSSPKARSNAKSA
jgi:hypothetical protein